MPSDRSEPDIESSIWIARPPQEVWNYLVDVSNDTQWRDGVTDARWDSGPPHGVGSTGLHAGQGTDVMTWRVTEWEEPLIFSWDVTGGRFEGGHAGYRLAPEEAGSRMTLHISVKPSVLMRILMLFMKGRIGRQLAADLEKLKVIMEA
jgi:uncharacterized protein YndB with AHSA1/START domain